MKTFKTLEELEQYNRSQIELFNSKTQNDRPEFNFEADYFQRITQNSQPHKIFNSDWGTYYTKELADTFLPYAEGYITKGTLAYDGAELFADSPKVSEKLMPLLGDTKLISTAFFTYPKGVKMEQKKDSIQLEAFELAVFAEVEKDNKVDIALKFGENFKQFLQKYYSSKKQNVGITALESKTYKTTVNDFKESFSEGMVHFNQMEFILNLINIQAEDVYDSTEKLIDGKEENNIQKDFISGWWSKDYEGEIYTDSDLYNSYRSNLEKTVYFQVKVSDKIKEGTSISFKLFDYDGVFRFNPDDYMFDKKEVVKECLVRKVNNEKRITIELYLDLKWEENIKEERIPFSNNSIELYWSWTYGNTKWNSKNVQLNVYPSEKKLYIKPAVRGVNYKLPEMYSHKGDIITFAIELLPEGKIKKFVSIKIRITTKFKSLQEANEIYKQIFTEKINLDTNTTISSNYQVEELNHYFKVKNNAEKIFIEEENIELPVKKGIKLAVYDSYYKGIKAIKDALEFYSYFAIFKDTINMFPELSDNGKFNAPSLSTFVGMIPESLSAGIYAFALALTEWTMKDQKEEEDKIIDESYWVEWQNIKNQGLPVALDFIESNWAQKNIFRSSYISQETLDDLFKGQFQSLEKLREFDSLKTSEKKYVIISYRIVKEELGTFVDVVDCIYFND